MKPQSRKTGSLLLQPNDLELFRLLLHHFTALTRRQICRLFPQRGTRSTNRRLHKLLEARYLSCHTPSAHFLQPIPCYYLGPQAFEPLELPPDDPDLLRQRRRGKRLRDRNLSHFVLLNDVCIRFRTAEREDPYYKLLTWIPPHHSHWQTLLRYRFPIRPDAYAEYSKDSLRFHVFIELDRGTEHAPRLHEKLARYHDYAASGSFARHFGVPRFRVLFIVPSSHRLHVLLRAIGPYTPDLFWLSTFDDFFSRPLFHPIWRTNNSPNHTSALSEPYLHESLPHVQIALPQ